MLFIAGTPVSTVAAADSRPSTPVRPNILFIMSDQHSARALGCAGNAEIRTPNLDRLAAAGVRFENAFTQTAQCCPSRYTIWTGRYAHSHGCRWNQVVEPLEEITIMEVLREAGYATGGFGKHHMMHSPLEHGMDVVVDMPRYAKFLRDAGRPGLTAEGDWIPGVRLGGAPVGVTPLDNDHHPAGYWTTHVLDFIRKNKDRPFFVHYSFYGPHTPIIASKPWADWYDPSKLTLPPSFATPNSNVPVSLTRLRSECRDMTEADHRRTLACYYALVSQIDHNIGRVLDELERLGIADRTIVVYTADHGDMAGEQRSWTKTTANYDGTVHIPLIVRLPAQGPTGVVRRELVGLVDLMPTLCELAGVEAPDKVQGRSLVPLIRGEPVKWRGTIFSEIGYPGANQGRSVMARTHTHKYVHHENRAGDGPFEELFDLTKDPWEMRNEIGNPAYVAVADTLRTEIREWEQATDHAPMYPIREAPRRGSGRARE